MLSKILSKIVIWSLKTSKITKEDKALVTTALLKNIDALPIRDIITFDDDGTILIRGRKLEIEEAQILKQGADAMIDNSTRKIIVEQMLYEANKIGLHQGLNPDMIMFAKAVVWVMQQEERILKQLEER